jgi:hypothetical protein
MMNKAMMLLVGLAAIAAVHAQSCTCSAGYQTLSQGDCESCALGYSGGNATYTTSWDATLQKWRTDGTDEGNDAYYGSCVTSTCDARTTCNGHGKCNGRASGKQCDCDANFAGDTCNECDTTADNVWDDYANYPNCNVKFCTPHQPADATNPVTGTCNNHGTCVEPVAKLEMCGGEVIDSATQQCCSWTSKGFWAQGNGRSTGDISSGSHCTVSPTLSGCSSYDQSQGKGIPNLDEGYGGFIGGSTGYLHSSVDNGLRQNTWVNKGITKEYVLDKEYTCCGWNADTACTAEEKCHDDGALHRCIVDKSEWTPCRASFENGTARSWDQGGIKYCLPHETCCDGTCCKDSSEACEDKAEPREGWVYPSDIQGFSGDFVDATSMPVVFKKGDALGYTPKLCTTYLMNSFAALRAGVLPAFLLLLTAAITALVFKGRSGAPALVKICSAIVVFFCIFLFFNKDWGMGVLLSFGAWVAIWGTSSKGWSNAGLIAFLVDASIFFTFLGGISGFFVGFVGDAGVFDGYNQNVDWYDAVDKQGLVCATYYNYFFTDSNTAPTVWGNGADTYWGYCSPGWLAAVEFFKIGALTAFFVLLALVSKETFFVDGSTSTVIPNPAPAKVPEPEPEAPQAQAIAVPAEAPADAAAGY